MDWISGRLPLVAEANLAYVFLIAAILVATLTMFLRLYRYQARQKRGGAGLVGAERKEADSRGLRADAPESVVRWEVEMQEIARDLKAELDSKTAALGHLIRDADRAAARLEAALDASGTTAAAPTADQGPSCAPSREAEGATLQDEVYILADYGFSVGDIASRLDTPVGQIELILRLREEKK